MPEPREYRCQDGCGNKLLIEDPTRLPSDFAWHWLPISGRWRCPECVRALGKANAVTCPLPTYDCACKGDWCRLLGRNLRG